jgi:hypothetical protein
MERIVSRVCGPDLFPLQTEGVDPDLANGQTICSVVPIEAGKAAPE